jgi:hypothetical protein
MSVPPLWAILGLVVLLAGCAGEGASTSPSGRAPEASAFFLAGEDTIEVRGFGRAPLDRAELIAPDGTTQTALDRQNEYVADAIGARPSVGIGGGGGSRGAAVGVGLNFPIATELVEGGWYRSPASFPILDREIYRATWRDWRIRLRFLGPGEPMRQLELPAPELPSPSNAQSR